MKKRNNLSQNVQTLQTIINNTFKTSLREFQTTEKMLKVGDHVMAKMRGYSPWPARIISFTKGQRSAKCYFYGSHNNGSVTIKEIVPFENASETIRLIATRKPIDFIKGVREIEIERGISQDQSVVKEIEALQSN